MIRMIFGVGKTLYNNWKYIKKYYNPDLAIDNNQDMWGENDRITGLPCISPYDLSKYADFEVLITVGDPYSVDSISTQLADKGIKIVYLSEKIKEWSVYEPFPLEVNIHNQNKRIWLVNTPEHDNLGDHLIAKVEVELIKKINPECELFEITDMNYLWNRERLRTLIMPNDIIIITGGGFLGSMWLYNGENTVREIIADYPNNRIIVFPQTVYFEKNERGKKEFLKSKKIYKSHDKLFFCLREKKSYDLLKSLFRDESKLYLLPDMALFLNYSSPVEIVRNKVAICLRSDKESALKSHEKDRLIQMVKRKTENVCFITTHSGDFEGKTSREEQIRNKLDEIASYSLIITDTLHCMIFAAICGTPCIAIDNLSQKVSSVYEWIRELQYVKFCMNLDDMDSIINKLFNCPGKFVLPNRERFEAEIKSILC